MKSIYKLQHPEIQIFFYEKTEDGFVFMQIKDDVLLPDCALFPESLYKTALQYAEQWQKPHEFYEYLRVDESYFYDDVMRALQQEFAEK